MESTQKERQISVDPISLKEPHDHHQPPLLPAKPNFLSSSLPNSASSSPRFSTSLFKKKPKIIESHASPRQVQKLHHREVHHGRSQLWRSKSCGDGRASTVYDEFDLPYIKPNVKVNYIDEYENKNCIANAAKDAKAKDRSGEEFKCCLFLPGFGKGKPERAKKEEEEEEEEEAEVGNVASRTVSMEKFECGSWASHEQDDGDSMNLYFDLPLELIQSGINDTSSPVRAAFVFDKERKGVLKNVNTKGTGRKSHESSRHVRFSVSSSPSSPGSCITPRLRKAREDFNAYLEAQSV